MPSSERGSGQGAPARSGPAAFVVLGAAGDLTQRKLLPALYNLARQRLLSDSFVLVGLGLILFVGYSLLALFTPQPVVTVSSRSVRS